MLRCAVKRNIEFCGDCEENKTCEIWKKHRELEKGYYLKLRGKHI